MTASMGLTLKYRSSRQEVWHWYWQMWRKKLWMYHAFFILMIFVYAAASNDEWPPRPLSMLYAAVGSGVLVGFFAAIPQLAFKSQERTLFVDENGVQTIIGRKSGSVTWAKVADIVDEGELLYIIRKNGNSFIIPRRAFTSDHERTKFVLKVRGWWSTSASVLAPKT